MMKLLISVFILSVFVIVSCGKELPDFAATAICDGATPTYTLDAAAVINSTCAISGCHNNSSKSDGLTLEGYTNAKKNFLNDKKNLASVHHADGVESMPKGGVKLPSEFIKILDCWVKNGCPE